MESKASLNNATQQDGQFPATSTIAIVGGGPVALYLALMLGRANINVVVFERDPDIVRRPKAAGHFPLVLEEFKHTGIYDDVIAAGYPNPIMEWHKADGELVGRVTLPNNSFGIQLEQYDLCDIMLRHLARLPSVQVLFGTTLVSFQESNGTVISTCTKEGQSDSGTLRHESQFLIGADGGKSTVRKQLGIPLEGYTWDDRVVTFNMIYPSQYMEDTFCGANFTVDPELWGVIIRLRSDNWRITFPVPSEKDNPFEWDEEKMMAEIKTVMTKLVPGPREKAKITNYAPYQIHQRCASSFLKGRVVLAGDAAHLTNPVGALGLTTGLLDAALLGRSLKKIVLEEQPLSLLEQYAEQRRSVFMNNTSPNAVRNIHLLKSTDPEVAKSREETFAKMNSFNPDFYKAMGQQIAGLSSTLGMPE